MKWCTHCGREKPRTDFYRGGKGYPNGRCKGCHRYFAREASRLRYRIDGKYRADLLARQREAYRRKNPKDPSPTEP